MIRDNFDYIHAHPEIYFTQEAKKGGYVCPVCGNGSGSNGTGVKLIKGPPIQYFSSDFYHDFSRLICYNFYKKI